MRPTILALVLAMLIPAALRAQRLEPRLSEIGAGVGAAVGVVSFLVQDGTDNEFWPINLVVLVTGNTALGAAVGAFVGWIAS